MDPTPTPTRRVLRAYSDPQLSTNEAVILDSLNQPFTFQPTRQGVIDETPRSLPQKQELHWAQLLETDTPMKRTVSFNDVVDSQVYRFDSPPSSRGRLRRRRSIAMAASRPFYRQPVGSILKKQATGAENAPKIGGTSIERRPIQSRTVVQRGLPYARRAPVASGSRSRQKPEEPLDSLIDAFNHWDTGVDKK